MAIAKDHYLSLSLSLCNTLRIQFQFDSSLSFKMF